jgi:hypothetical protein
MSDLHWRIFEESNTLWLVVFSIRKTFTTSKKRWEKELKREREIHQQQRDVLMNQIKDLQQELQSVRVSVCCKHLDLWDYWDMLLLVCHRTL